MNMAIDVAAEVATLQMLTIGELRTRFAELFGELTLARHRVWLVKRIVWRLQALAEGDLSERARRRAAELANDADLRATQPQALFAPKPSANAVGVQSKSAAKRPALTPGMVLSRAYKGQTLRVKVVAQGFLYNDAVFNSQRRGQGHYRLALQRHLLLSPQPQRSRHMSSANGSRPTVHVAVYARKSTAEGLEQEFNSLDAQREAGEAFIKSQASEGWVCLPERYEDGGFTGANMDRPALQRLLQDCAAGKVQAVVAYKVDRLSRSLLDFAKMMETFEHQHVAFVSVTQQFNTATSMGRLILNVLLSFAQFERDIISERTRDKLAAARRKGKRVGGMPPLGYDVDPRAKRLIVNEKEAVQVRVIFELYLQLGGVIPVVQELDRRCIVTKRWLTQKGRHRGGRPFHKTSLHYLLSNVVYTGKVRYKDELHPGEHAAIIDETLWRQVQATLKAHAPRVVRPRLRNDALLQGLLRCGGCACAMTPGHGTRGRARLYRNYICLNALKRGREACRGGSVPGPAIEQFVLEQLQARNILIAQAADWETLSAAEKNRRLRTHVREVVYDGAGQNVAITLHEQPATDSISS
jgi:DNA invertase Pin-like site-specific DNA recombinase